MKQFRSPEPPRDADVNNNNWNKSPKWLQSTASHVDTVVRAAERVASLYGPWGQLADKAQIILVVGKTVAEVISSSNSKRFIAYVFSYC
jgi:hypothetical protein